MYRRRYPPPLFVGAVLAVFWALGCIARGVVTLLIAAIQLCAWWRRTAPSPTPAPLVKVKGVSLVPKVPLSRS